MWEIYKCENVKVLDCLAEFCPYIFPPPPVSEKGRVVFCRLGHFSFAKDQSPVWVGAKLFQGCLRLGLHPF